eukprot:scaffold5024_cov136-Cylindrotheca_fusiformis.AAC.17
MPELPEVERFRHALLPLVSTTNSLNLRRMSLEKQPPRKFLSDEEINKINEGKFKVSDVIRKGKKLCLVLNNNSSTWYLFVHMGMTGHISTPNYAPKLKEVTPDVEFPPAFTYLLFSTENYEASFSDPRKFGHVLLKASLDDFDELAPDALNDLADVRSTIEEKIAGQSSGIKSILLDQKRCISGIGNWVADEVLYQAKMHPDQAWLTIHQANNLLNKLQKILQIAVESLVEGIDFPQDWLFHYRWNKKKTTKDAMGQTITFITSGGRTTAIAPSIQTIKLQNPGEKLKAKNSGGAKAQGDEHISAGDDAVAEDRKNNKKLTRRTNRKDRDNCPRQKQRKKRKTAEAETNVASEKGGPRRSRRLR